ncbi:inositol polyphosphate 5-phosphatase OCRL-like isoform X2 [Ostrea edulis]|uniref:inositol polyphosphate 5-phosphatase OCRL-like isoform X2 n=1 Tax=Ostrea edulis TaxID=37623 RepID=UPI0024AE98F1|nr:inositol polyphosphate 5-phosphatase OCRL-like isoform X2 [Ostrea edulis]
MEITPFVRRRLRADEKVLYCAQGRIIEDSIQADRYIAVIQKQSDTALFLFSSRGIPCTSEADLAVEDVIKINEDFHIRQNNVNRQSSLDDFDPLKNTEQVVDLFVGRKNLRLLLQDGVSAKALIGYLQKSQSQLPQGALQGLPSSFAWTEKYRHSQSDCLYVSNVNDLDNPFFHDTFTPEGSQNPFQKDVFDPMKYMNLSDGEKNVIATDNVPMRRMMTSSMDDNMTDPLSALRKADSRESLDRLDESYYEDEENEAFPDSLRIITNQLGIPGSGVELVNNLKPTTAREHVVRHYMRQREDEFTYKKYYSVFCGTWNVNGQHPPTTLNHWLSRPPSPPDIYVIGFQELDLSNQAYVFSDSPKEEEWHNAVRKSLPPKVRYRKVKLIRMVGIMMLVYIKESLVPDVPPHLIDADSVATGIMGIMGNKGGVGVRMTLHNTSLCFVNTHLAAHQDEYERRNQDYRDVDSKMRFKQFLPPLTISEHDQIFWIGDLNYRINGLDIDKVKAMIDREKYQDLLSYDQLHQQLGRSDVFKDYQEGNIHFKPTYKYNTGTNDWDSSEKNRIPAWCDRILYKGEGIEQVQYTSHPDLLISDHKPVSSLFNIEAKVIDKEKSNKVYEDIMKKLDRLENDYLPQVKLDKTEFLFKDVMFIEKRSEMLTVCNTGQVPVEFEFINKLEEESYCQPWLRIKPFKSVITPGSSCEIRIEVLVDKSCVASLNASNHVLDDILVLHLNGGKDFFVTVNGNFIPSSFGCSLEALVQMHGPIRETPTAQLIEIEQPGSLMSRDLTQGGRLYAVPKEIWRLVDHIWHYGKTQGELFQQSGYNKELQAIRDCLDMGVPEKMPGSVHSVAEALLLFLECLPDPVIPSRVYYRCLECCGNYMLCKQVISQIPEHHKNLFRYVCAFLRELLNHSQQNNLDINILSSIFGEIFLRAPPVRLARSLSTPAGKAKAKEEEMKRGAFVYHFLANETDD